MGETIRVEHCKDYTVISNLAIRDKRLSFKSRGIHHLLLSYPDGWKINIAHLSEQSDKDGQSAIASALKELEQLGYLTRTQLKEKGKIVGYESVIRELPIDNPPKPTGRRGKKKQVPQLENPQLENPQLENPQLENPVHNKYLFNEVINQEVSREEVSIPPYPQSQNGEEKEEQSQSVACEIVQVTIPEQQKPESLYKTNNPSLGQNSPAPLATVEKTADRVRRVWQETGILPKEPLEFEAWVQEDLGTEIIALYRKSGRTVTTKRGDINPSFAKYVSEQWKGKDIDYGYNCIRSMERDPQKWEALASLVKKWQAATVTGNSAINLTQEFNNRERTGPPIDFGGRRR